MSEAMESELKELKCLIKGLLISSPRNLTLSDLNSDFKNQEGYSIPYFKFGYSSLIDFLKSIPDAVQVTVFRNGATPVVSPVVTAKTAHIDSMVMKQKAKSSKKRPNNRSRLRDVPRFTAAKAAFLVNSNLSSKPNFPKCTETSNHFFETKFTTKNIPEINKKTWLSTSSTNLSSKTNSDVKKFPETLSSSNSLEQMNGNKNEVTTDTEVFGKELDSFQNLAKSKRNWKFIPQSMIDKITSMVRSFDKGMKISDFQHFINSSFNLSMFGIDRGFEELLNHIPHLVTENGRVKLTKNHYLEVNLDVTDRVSQEEMEFKNYPIASPKPWEYSPDNSSCNSLISDTLIENFRKILNCHKDGIICSQFPKKYQEEFGVPFNYQSYGYFSMIQMAANLPQIFHCIQMNETDYLLTDSREVTKLSEEITKQRCFVPSSVRQNIMNLVENFPQGIHSRTFLECYESCLSSTLDVNQFGFNSLKEFLLYLKQEELVNMYSIGESFIIYPPEKENIPDEPALPPMSSNDELKKLIENEWLPIDVVKFGTKIPLVNLPENSANEFFPLRVGDVKTPMKFWIMVGGQEKQDELDTFMNKLQTRYVLEKDSFLMPPAEVKIGMYCCCLYEHEWHRAVVLDITELRIVKISYIDYGTISKIDITELYFLHSDFSYYPAQAIECQLPDIMPINKKSDWSSDACTFFLSLVSNKILMGFIKKHFDGGKIELELIDTNGVKDINIAKTLCSRGYADIVTSRKSITLSSDVQLPYQHTLPEVEKEFEKNFPCSNFGDTQQKSVFNQNWLTVGTEKFLNKKEHNNSILCESELTNIVHKTNVTSITPLDQKLTHSRLSTVSASRSTSNSKSSEFFKKENNCSFASQNFLKDNVYIFKSSHKLKSPEPFELLVKGETSSFNPEISSKYIPNSRIFENKSHPMNLVIDNKTSLEPEPFINSSSLLLSTARKENSVQVMDPNAKIFKPNSEDKINSVIIPCREKHFPVPRPPPGFGNNILVPFGFIYPIPSAVLNIPVVLPSACPVSTNSWIPYQQNVMHNTHTQPIIDPISCSAKQVTVQQTSSECCPFKMKLNDNYSACSQSDSNSLSRSSTPNFNQGPVTILNKCVALPCSFNNKHSQCSNGIEEITEDFLKIKTEANFSEDSLTDMKFKNDSKNISSDNLVDLMSELSIECREKDQSCTKPEMSFKFEDNDEIFISDDETAEKDGKQNAEKHHERTPITKEQQPEILKESELAKSSSVVKLGLDNHSTFLIKVNSTWYISTDEFVEMFTPFDNRHVFVKILNVKRISVKFIDITRRKNPDLFDELDLYFIENCQNELIGKYSSRMHLLPLQSVVKTLTLLGIIDDKRKFCLQEEIKPYIS